MRMRFLGKNWELRMIVDSSEEKRRDEIWYETHESSRMLVWLRLRVCISMTFSIEIFMIEASKLNEMLENLPLKCTYN